MSEIPSSLQQVADAIHKTKAPHTETVRTLLAWFGAKGRGSWVVAQISRALRKSELETFPRFTDVNLDSPIEFRLALKPAKDKATVNADKPAEDKSALHEEELGNSVPTIGLLPETGREVLSVKRDTTIAEATTKMLLHDYSQLPVMQGGRNPEGMISWKSIGQVRARNGKCELVRDCMDTSVTVLSYNTSLFSAMQTIIDKEVVLIEDPEKRISRIMTTTDLSIQFRHLSEAFLLISTIENHIRRIINKKFTLAELQTAKAPEDTGRKIDSIAAMTFGEYLRLLESKDRWDRLGYDLDRTEVVKRLHEVREIRNEVMHFHPDGPQESDIAVLRSTVAFLERLI